MAKRNSRLKKKMGRNGLTKTKLKEIHMLLGEGNSIMQTSLKSGVPYNTVYKIYREIYYG